jgi:hypothetical protein
MQVSGNRLPVPQENIDPSARHQPGRQTTPQRRDQDASRQNSQQTVEFILRGEVVEDAISEDRGRTPDASTIDPANQHAIFAYTKFGSANYSSTDRQGHLLDLFI